MRGRERNGDSGAPLESRETDLRMEQQYHRTPGVTLHHRDICPHHGLLYTMLHLSQTELGRTLFSPLRGAHCERVQ